MAADMERAGFGEINGRFDYEDSAFIGYNQIFLPRILDLRDGTVESQRRHVNARPSEHYLGRDPAAPRRARLDNATASMFVDVKPKCGRSGRGARLVQRRCSLAQPARGLPDMHGLNYLA